jgi:FkbH-like protein
VSSSDTLRDQIRDAAQAGNWALVQRGLRSLWAVEATPAAANYIMSYADRLRGRVSLSPCRVEFLRSFTIEPVIPLLRAASLIEGLDLEVRIGAFNTYAQDMLDIKSPLYEFSPDVVVLAVQTRDVAPELWDGVDGLSHEWAAKVAERVVDLYENLIAAFRQTSRAHLVIHGLDVPERPCHGYLDDQSFGQEAAITTINDKLRRMAHANTGVFFLDYASLVARHGRINWYDEHKWLTMRMPIAAHHLVHMANEWLRFLCPLMGKVGKVLVTDLDNTLWGGVIGEDGIEKIRIGSDYPGSAYRAVQTVMKDLTRRGIILAVCSKNNLADAMEALEKHPGMVLRPKDFAALRINWNDKAHNLREIAKELNVGTDSLVFVDDNPVEREQVRQHLPEVTVVDLPQDPVNYARALREIPEFERLWLSEEDRERGRYYAAQRERKELEGSATSLEDFLWSLQQEVSIIQVDPRTIQRAAQLTQKTNQFNLTTKRYPEAELQEFARQPGRALLAVRVKDRFGDNGIVGVVLTEDVSGSCEIDTFLLSCRVIGRTVETAILAFLADGCRKRGLKFLEGWYRPTAKNAPCKECYAQHGFQPVETRGDDVKWQLRLDGAAMTCPPWIQLTGPV